MKGREQLKLSICLLVAAAGCQHQVMTLPSSAPLPSSTANLPLPEASQVKKVSPKSKELSPLVLVSYGDFEAGEAFAARTGPERQQQLCESARADYEKAIKIDPKCVPAYRGLARLYTALHDLPLAVENYQKALQLAPNDAALWFELGLCYNYQRNWGSALECFHRAAQIDPGNRSYTNALGIVYAETGRYEDSLKCFARCGGEAIGYYRLAQTLRRLQKPELSRRCLEIALQKDPSLAPSIQQTAYRPAVSPEPNPASTQSTSAIHPSSPSQVLLPPLPLPNGENEQANP